ncbi:hypothetical protein [Streptomyces beijiangensis]|uniref:Secreted protein n=1 Tax=Streptomyces beijiangensis TaxID=163361 RepID=A0A939JK88_9ACTN|nr:hypothetical protein [Streptomyces beijiangensis]MBO0514429.1 hypothetical protein [Streptomyces beijiangensis]
MKLKVLAGLGVLASFVVATPAVAAQAPVVVPLQGLDAALPMDAPTLRTGIPIPVPGTPDAWHPRSEGELSPELAIPQTPVTSDLPRTVLAAPLPSVLDDEDLGRARVTSDASQMAARTPGFSLGRPITPGNGEDLGLPEIGTPQAAVLAPALQGDLSSGLGMDVPAV